MIKAQEPELDSKGRHAVVHQLWTQLHDRHKLAYVLMSRADREKSLYIIRLNQIRDELKQSFPAEFADYEASAASKRSLEADADRPSEFAFGMHGLTALEQINEKMAEELL